MCQNCWQMPRQCWIAVVFLCSACGPSARSAESLLPPTVAGVWQRKSLGASPPSQPPARRAFEATYEGRGKLTADVYELNSSAQGLDLVQRWKPAPDTVFFYRDNYFVVIRWDRADRQALTAFVRELEKQLGAGKPRP
jgi:hypothetical protein